MNLHTFNTFLNENYAPEEPITINLWDDYTDDSTEDEFYGDQETNIFVEEMDMPKDIKEELCKFLISYIEENYKPRTATFSLMRDRRGTPEIYVKDLTHKELDEVLLPMLKASNLKFRGWDLRFISES